ncbi:hypothetical protein AAHA92_14296 [Salvia divinorum]|uniref:Uncharacterized protein n=1 Tax=Salvia divinorum TaxID=28513 RepID=A0ABD1HF36_SALDI
MKTVIVLKRIALVLVTFLIAMAVTGESTRLVKSSSVFNNLLGNRLPRGPVPPSGPSFCHNKMDPSSYNGAKFQQDVSCP